jgi:hypothetical protein
MHRRMAVGFFCAAALVRGQGFAPLKKAAVREAPGIEQYVRNPKLLVALGKALFWDMQVGADNRTACATWHFHAGVDHRAHRLSEHDFPFSSVRRRRRHSLGHPSRFEPEKRVGRRDSIRNGRPAARDAAQYADCHQRRVSRADASRRQASDVFTGRTPFGDSDTRANAAAMVNGELVP